MADEQLESGREPASIMLVECNTLVRPVPGLLDSLDEVYRKKLLAIGHARTFQQDEQLWQQGDLHEGIYLITEGRVKSFYIAPSGREVTLAYWMPSASRPAAIRRWRRCWGRGRRQNASSVFSYFLRRLTA